MLASKFRGFATRQVFFSSFSALAFAPSGENPDSSLSPWNIQIKDTIDAESYKRGLFPRYYEQLSMDDVHRYELHAEQAFMCAPPLGPDADSREIGPYPHIPPVDTLSYQFRSQYIPWDDPNHRRMYDEPVGEDWDQLAPNWYPDVETISPMKEILTYVFGLTGIIGAMVWWGEGKKLPQLHEWFLEWRGKKENNVKEPQHHHTTEIVPQLRNLERTFDKEKSFIDFFSRQHDAGEKFEAEWRANKKDGKK